MNRLINIFCFLFLSYNLSAQLNVKQEKKIDSIKKVIKFAQNDTTIIDAWIAWDNIIFASNPSLDLKLNLKIDSLSSLNLSKKLSRETRKKMLNYKGLALNVIGLYYTNIGKYAIAKKYLTRSFNSYKKSKFKEGQSIALRNHGNVFFYLGNYDDAIKKFNHSLAIEKEIDNKIGIISTQNNLGNVYFVKGNYAESIKYYMLSLKIADEIGDIRQKSDLFSNIGNIYSKQGDLKKSLEFHLKSLKLRRQYKQKAGIAISLNNIARIYNEEGQFSKALSYSFKALKIRLKINDKGSVAVSQNSIGEIYFNLGNYNLAMKYFKQGLSTAKEIKNKRHICSSLNCIGKTYEKQGYHLKALGYIKKALDLAQEIGVLEEVKYASESLWKINKKLGKYKKALTMHEIYIKTRDSMQSEENQREIIQQEYQYSYEKQSLADSLEYIKKKELQQIKYQSKLNNEAQRRYVLYAGIGFLFVLGGFIFVAYQRKKKDNILITEQKYLVDEKNKEITDSITYAKRIQSAIIPSSKIVQEYLQESFIIYNPKDIVAGDFYWIEAKENKTLFAAADCTGHGVPGAMVSVICNNGLNRSVREYNLSDPGKILDQTSAIVVQEFEKSDEDVKDGMDIALCSLEGYQLQYAGANNPLWIIRKDSHVVEEIKANKQPIGKYTNSKLFTTHTLQVAKGDNLYIFSDGYADQFGGEKGKKFKTANFKKLLLSIQNEPMDKQKTHIEKAFEDWKGEQEQVDDVCVIGVKVL